MSSPFLSRLLAAGLFVSTAWVGAVSAADPVTPPTAPDAVAPSASAPSAAVPTGPLPPNGRTVLVMAALDLKDPVKAQKVQDALSVRALQLQTWHSAHDAQLKKLWIEFNKAHGKKDEAATEAVNDKITAVYAEIRPGHDAFLAKLNALLTPAQVELVEDKIIEDKLPQERSKFAATYRNYQTIFPGLTPDQKAFIAAKLRSARDEALDAQTSIEKSAFFKKYKNRIEAYLTAQGYDVKKSYYDFGQKLKAEMAANKAKGSAAPAPVFYEAPSTKPQ